MVYRKTGVVHDSIKNQVKCPKLFKHLIQIFDDISGSRDRKLFGETIVPMALKHTEIYAYMMLHRLELNTLELRALNILDNAYLVAHAQEMQQSK